MKFTIQNPFLFIGKEPEQRGVCFVTWTMGGISSFRRADGTAVAVTEVLTIWLRLKPETNMGFCICCATCVLILNKVK